ncbi:substrate-binding domain-containing protein [Microbacterium sp. PMB16]|uniref:substrate-binding domain-containing protein n=1 Tax=Microbacterium sp. PMB16 TaxID=3120157 RepID=UPI003F4BF8D1
MATKALLADLAAAATASGLPGVEIESVGGVDAARRVAEGEQFDLIFLASEAMVELVDRGHVVPSSVRPLVLSQTAVAVHAAGYRQASAPTTPAFEDADALRAALRRAERIGYSTGPSGTMLLRQIEDWGMAGELRDRLVRARPGTPVAALVREGEVDLGFQQLSELAGYEGVRILGVLPPDCAIDTIFAGGISARAADPLKSRTVLSFFAAPAAASIKAQHSFQDISLTQPPLQETSDGG